MKDRTRNVRRQQALQATPGAWNRCPRCRGLADADDVHDGSEVRCGDCGLDLVVVEIQGGGFTLDVRFQDLGYEDGHECDVCGGEEPCLCREEADDLLDGIPEEGFTCGGCGTCEPCVEETVAHFEAEREEVCVCIDFDAQGKSEGVTFVPEVRT